MADIFTMKDNVPEISIEGVNIPIFKKIWRSDKNRYKTLARGECAYVYHMVRIDSPYFSLPDDEKEYEIIKTFIPEKYRAKWKPSPLVKEAIQIYKGFPPNNTPTVRLLKAANSVADKLATYFNDIDFTERDENGQPVYDAKKVVDTMKSLRGVVDYIQELEDTVKKGIMSGDVRVEGGATFSIIEDLN